LKRDLFGDEEIILAGTENLLKYEELERNLASSDKAAT
jgi:hypothetical protein